MAKSPPSPNGPNGGAGRDPATGRFAAGWKGGPGNPHAKQVGRLRSAMLAAVSDKEMKAIVKKLVQLAKSGSVPAAKEVLDRCLGRPVEADLIERLEQLETLMAEREGVHR